MKSFKYALISAIAFAVVSSDAITVSDAKGRIPEILSEPVKLMDIVPSIYPASDIPEFMSALDSAVTTYPASLSEKQKIQGDVGYWSVCSTNCIASSAKDEPSLMVRSLADLTPNAQMNVRPSFIEPRGYPCQTISFSREEERDISTLGNWRKNRHYVIRIRSTDGGVQFLSGMTLEDGFGSTRVNWASGVNMGKRYLSIVNALKDLKHVEKGKRVNCAIVLYMVKESDLTATTSYDPLVKYDDPSNGK